MNPLLKTPVRELMTHPAVSVGDDSTIKEVFAVLKKHDIVGVPVVNAHQKVVGIVTESDLIKHFTTLGTPRAIDVLGSLVYLESLTEFNQHLKEHCSEWVRDLMTPQVVVVQANAPLQTAIDLMEANGVNRLPVVDEQHRLVGMLTRSNLLKHLTL
ncbi:CBS domain-containing protein [Candidatus Peregrinibacteria bacterium]|nr:MAG: CBS domain-containing protein [Candidatus Peregrinibacteria bacterium]